MKFAEDTKEHDGPAEGGEPAPIAETRGEAEACIFCKSAPIEFETNSCGHAAACKKCAMKTATGGKCRKCGQMYAGWRHI
mmetsp:Transcript_137443/g.342864  ORF Transcript_137443/g.342864 Transcript_137443/m.342864 type:complete len:80 (+) Transcript_137443:61-300(+)